MRYVSSSVVILSNGPNNLVGRSSMPQRLYKTRFFAVKSRKGTTDRAECDTYGWTKRFYIVVISGRDCPQKYRSKLACNVSKAWDEYADVLDILRTRGLLPGDFSSLCTDTSEIVRWADRANSCCFRGCQLCSQNVSQDSEASQSGTCNCTSLARLFQIHKFSFPTSCRLLLSTRNTVPFIYAYHPTQSYPQNLVYS